MRLKSERQRLISRRTKEALRELKLSGHKLGSPSPKIGAKIGGKVSAKRRHDATVERDKVLLAAAGAGTLEERAERLNAAGYKTAHGHAFTRAIMSRMVRRAAQKP